MNPTTTYTLVRQKGHVDLRGDNLKKTQPQLPKPLTTEDKTKAIMLAYAEQLRLG